MKTYTPDELKLILAKHIDYVNGVTGGERADLRGANLGGANLWGADLRGADLRGADLRGANLGGANLGGANLWDANLGGADLRGANLWGADLRGADLRGANLRDANLRGANLWDANLGGANLGGANLRGADLRGANLRGADLRGANLRGARWDDATQWPAMTAVLLANWGEVSDALCRDLMRYDACNHPDPAAFDRWAKGGACPYDGTRVQRAAQFEQKKELWSPGPVKPWDIFQRLLAEKLVKGGGSQ